MKYAKIDSYAIVLRILLTLSLAIAPACGPKKSKQAPAGPGISPIEAAFATAARTHNLPQRMIMAVGYLESGLNPTASTASYDGRIVGPAIGDSAFGIDRAALGLNSDAEPSLENQIDAYARWLRSQLTGLETLPTSSDDKFTWLVQIGNAHRGEQFTNVRAVFLRELIDTMNEGFTWKDPVDGSIRQFAKENPPIDPEKLLQMNRNLMDLFVQPANSQFADLFPEIRPNVNPGEGIRPRGIVINHCPFSLSACLKMQLSEQDGRQMYLGAHYFIPPEEKSYPKAIQISLENNPVPYLDQLGARLESDRVIITLVGKSGYIDKGVRRQANPRWLTKWQLQTLGTLVENVCQRLSRRLPEPDITLEDCRTVGKGILFQTSEGRSQQKWGDIADFDEPIFTSHIKKFTDTHEGVSFSENGKTSQSSPISINLDFLANAKAVVLQQLVRCQDNRLRWYSFLSRPVGSQTTFAYPYPVDDPGPNGNGEHFFRAKVYGPPGEDGHHKILGWDITSVFLKDYDAQGTPYLEDACN